MCFRAEVQTQVCFTPKSVSLVTTSYFFLEVVKCQYFLKQPVTLGASSFIPQIRQSDEKLTPSDIGFCTTHAQNGLVGVTETSYSARFSLGNNSKKDGDFLFCPSKNLSPLLDEARKNVEP